MKFNIYFKTSVIFFLIFFSTPICPFAQTQLFPAPREEKLLNGTKLLVWNDAKAEKVIVKVRINGGSAFDPQGKEGVMQLLADILFANESIKEFFTDDLGGKLEITTNYDYIQINASGNSDKFLTIMETLATAVTNPAINPETTEKVRAALLAKVKEYENDPAYVADRAVAKRLLGIFPYGRPQPGSSESVAKIDFADLLLAKQKFLTADNATITISGNVKADFALRATKRLFGGWLKADKKVPPTFAQAAPPDTSDLRIASPIDSFYGMRSAFRGLARNDRDYFSSQVFVHILQTRWLENIEPSHKDSFFVRQEAHLLPGFIVFGFKSSISAGIAPNEQTVVSENRGRVEAIISKAIIENEFTNAKSAIRNDLNKKPLDEMWLDVETFKLVSVKDDLQKINAITIQDVQRVLENLIKNPMVTVYLAPQMPPRNPTK